MILLVLIILIIQRILLFLPHFSKNTVQMIQSKPEICCELVASWQVQVGDADQCLHLWRYVGGFEKVDLAYKTLYRDDVS